MPHKWATDKVPMPRDHDKRIRLTDAQREEIRLLYGTVSQRKLAKRYGVSRRTIQFIGAPEKLAKMLKARKALERQQGTWTKHYGREYNRVHQLTHRRYKTKVLKEDAKEG